MPPRGLSLPLAAERQVAAGAPLLEWGSLPPTARSLEPGRPVVLLGRSGEALGTAVADPENEVLRVVSRLPLDSVDLPFFRRKVTAALALREALGLVDGVSSYRLLNAEGDGLSGFVADVHGPFAVLYAYSRGLLNLGRILAQALLEVASAQASVPPLRGVVLKVRPKGGITPGKVKQEVIGEEPPEKLVVKEHGVPYEVHLLSGINVGLFTDMREHRRGLARFVRGRSVLNTFAYTGALSVAAARGGAREVTSVDLSSGVLKWARENFRLSGLDPEDPRYRFVEDDVLRFIKSEKERGARYETIVLDPPTVSAARAAGWSMKNDYPALIAHAMDLLPEDRAGFLWVSANVQRAREVHKHVDDALALRRREVRVLEQGGLPPDYPTLWSYPQGRYLEVVQLEVL